MSLIIFMTAALSSAPLNVQSTGDSRSQNSAVQNSAAQNTPAQKIAPRRKARVTLVASATIMRRETVNPLLLPAKPNDKVERPIAQQRVVKGGVPYVEFY